MHLLVESLPRKDSGFFWDVAETRLPLNFETKIVKREGKTPKLS